MSAPVSRTCALRSTVWLACLLLALTGCTGARPEVTPEQALAAAKKQLDTTSGVRIGLSTPRLPTGVNGLLTAKGVGTHAPAFSGDIRISSGGVAADAPVVAVAGGVYAKLPFTSSFARIDPGDYGAPDPAGLMSRDGGLSSLLTAAEDVEKGERVRKGEDVLTSYAGTVPGSAVASVIPSASPSSDFDATFTLTDKQRLAEVVLAGPFYPKAKDVTYTVSFDEYDTKKRIEPPPVGR